MTAVFLLLFVISQADAKASDGGKSDADLLEHANELNDEISSVGESIQETEKKIRKKQKEVEKNELDLAAAKLSEQNQLDAMKQRIKFMYEGGNISLLQILLHSEDMADFLNNAEYISVITNYDREMLSQLTEVRNVVQQKQDALDAQEKELADLQKSLEDKQGSLEEELVETQEKIASPETIALMAGILECEAGISYEGMIAVGTVIMNRVTSSQFPDSISGVVYQSGQFSPVASGFLDNVLQKGPPSDAYRAAKAVLGGERNAEVRNCLYFNATFTGKKGIVVGDNVFW